MSHPVESYEEKKKVVPFAKLLSLYEDPSVAGSLGEVTHFAKVQKFPLAKVHKRLEADFGYTLNQRDVFALYLYWTWASTNSGWWISS